MIKLTPVIDHSFDLATMTAYAVGPAWATFAPADKHVRKGRGQEILSPGR